VLEDEENWREWGNWLVKEPSFAKAGCPETTGFDTSEAWAQAVCACRTDFT
jgi:hypothetical protein